MRPILDILNEIADNPSKNAKVDMVWDNLDNFVFMKTLDAALNPYRTYHIKKIPKIDGHSGNMSLAGFLNILYKFESREVTGHAARDLLAQCLSDLTESDAEVATRIIRRNLKSGFDASTVNKAKLGTIPVYPCLLASKQTPAAVAKIVFPAYSQVKADGMRANMFLEGDRVVIRGRSGKFIDLMGRFDFLLDTVRDGTVLDGELIVLGDDGKALSRAQGNGMLNKAIRGSVTEEIADNVRYVIWDYIHPDEFNRPEKKAPIGAIPYSTRWGSVEAFVELVNSPKVKAIEHKLVNSMEEVEEHFNHVRELEEEGVIIKNIDHPWENRRSQHLVKFKAKYDCDLEVIGWNYGKVGHKWEHTVGSLICASSDRMVVVSVPWMSDELRAEIFENFDDEWMGTIIAVEYNSRETKKGSDVDSLFIPGLLERREDKSVADSSEDIEYG